jgi:hypothetical protein
MQAIEVTASFSSDGKVQPLKLRWQGREYQVEAAGRRWQSEDGLHILVIAVTGMLLSCCSTRCRALVPGAHTL